MPFIGDEEQGVVDFAPVRSDLDKNGNYLDHDEADDHDQVVEEALATVVNFDDDDIAATDDLDEEDEEIPTAPVSEMGEDDVADPAASTKKRGRATPAKKTAAGKPENPKSAKGAAAPSTSGRKRKAAADADDAGEATPAKRGRPARATATSARLAVKEAAKPTRGRPKGSGNGAKQGATTKTAKTRGRPRKDTVNGNVPAGEFEVEAIVDSAIDADTMEHKYLVKWKGYDAKDNSWEPKSNLAHAAELVRKFEARKKASKGEDEEEPVQKEPKKPGRKRGRKPKAAS